MTPALPVSVVVVSRERPAALARCILGLTQLQYSAFEIIVVADAAGLAAVAHHGDLIKTQLFETANISAARNLGINASGGAIVAVIDDDAVPEPTWLTFLTAPFADPSVDAVGGFVRGRNGISFQWKARILDSDGWAAPITVDETQWSIPQVRHGHAIKTEGTNMGVRRETLVALGGFDPAYHFFLDETDLNVRLARAGHVTAIAPLAQVHHGFDASARRRPDRVPRDLFDIGASWAVFARKFIAADRSEAHLRAVEQGERKRLMQHMITGGLEPRAVAQLMDRLRMGFLAGAARDLGQGGAEIGAPRAFQPFPATSRHSAIEVSGLRRAGLRRAQAKARVKSKEILTLMILSPTALFHRVLFHPDGYWQHKGGVFGKADRDDPLIQISSKPKRRAREIARIGQLRGLRPKN